MLSPWHDELGAGPAGGVAPLEQNGRAAPHQLPSQLAAGRRLEHKALGGGGGRRVSRKGAAVWRGRQRRSRVRGRQHHPRVRDQEDGVAVPDGRVVGRPLERGAHQQLLPRPAVVPARPDAAALHVQVSGRLVRPQHHHRAVAQYIAPVGAVVPAVLRWRLGVRPGPAAAQHDASTHLDRAGGRVDGAGGEEHRLAVGRQRRLGADHHPAVSAGGGGRAAEHPHVPAALLRRPAGPPPLVQRVVPAGAQLVVVERSPE
mmetsp:Transcript_17835/g.58292  ORF Transcript_17835/g.58292 Transcript_17835/m.58292 type:complete len:258 (-) Transcript_17835:3287-4060(-)